jgi:hypothetical protein
MAKTRRRNKAKKKKTYTKKDYESGDGMVTRIWGPWAWCFLHTISFNYPAQPTLTQKKQYRDFILSLQHVLPCGHCRKNLTKTLKRHPLTIKDMKNRETFSKWLYDLHEIVNKMLQKKSNLTYEQVRDRYEHFRSRCTQDSHKTRKKYKKCLCKKSKKKTRKKEKGCVTPLNGKKSKCVIKIVPVGKKCKTFQMDKKCIKKRI